MSRSPLPEQTITLPDGRRVHRFSVCTTRRMVYQVWEPIPSLMGHHSSITSFSASPLSVTGAEGRAQWWGKLGTRALTPELDALPAYSQERSDAVGAYHEEQYQEAYRLILAAFPEAAPGRRSMGEITLHVP